MRLHCHGEILYVLQLKAEVEAEFGFRDTIDKKYIKKSFRKCRSKIKNIGLR